MTDTPRAAIERLDADRSGVRVEFHWTGDRFEHTISALQSGETICVWRSVGSDDTGPAYQELHEQAAADGSRVVFLSGAASGAHWSLSVCAGADSIEFDLAARVSQPPVDRLVNYTCERCAAARPPLWHCEQGTLEGGEQQITLHAAPPAADQLPVTLRWKYRV